MIDIDQIEYRPFGNNKNFASIEEYNKVARGLLFTLAKRNNFVYNKGTIHNDSDLVANLVAILALADSRYDPNKGTSLTTWRFYCAKQFIIKRIKQNKLHYMPHIRLRDSHLEAHSYLSGQKTRINKEVEHIENTELINKYLNVLTDKEKDIIQKYFWDKQTFKQIAKQYKITKQRVDQVVQLALGKMKKIAAKDQLC